jgi:FixJ family two-component response regulator
MFVTERREPQRSLVRQDPVADRTGMAPVTEKGEVVYLVDDDAFVREAICDLLASFDLYVVSFGSAREYLEYARSDATACLVLDLELPDINGLDLQAQLARETGPPIIFITGHGDIPSSVRAMKAGAIEFLTKPIDTEALIASIRAAFAQDRIMREKTADLATLQRHLGQLTPREREVFPLVIQGLRNKQAAAILGITEITLQAHRGQIMRKMAARTFAELVRMGEKLGIALPESVDSRRN